MATLNDFLPNVATQDTRKRTQCYFLLLQYLGNPRSSLACDDTNGFIEGLAAWVTCSNYKISVSGLEILCLMVDRMGEDFKPHVNTALAACVDRLGDSKDQVREQAQQLLLKLMMPASNPQYVFERILGTFTHKLWLVREGVLICLQNAVNRYGARCLQLSKIVPSVCKLLEDPTPQVREAALNTLAEVYRHVGEKVRSDLFKKGISVPRLTQVFAKFDEIKMSGDMVATADLGAGLADKDEDDTDFARPLSSKVPHAKRSSSSTASLTTGSILGKKSGLCLSKSASATAARLSFQSTSQEATASAAGAVDEGFFIRSFEDVSKVQICSARDLTELLSKCKDVLSDTNITWEKRVDTLKTLRGILIAGGAEYDDFLPYLRQLEPCFIHCIKDLRSQVVREGCITVGYYSQQLGTKFDHGAETLLPVLVNLIPNSAKIMSTSGIVCIRFILQYTFTSRLIPIITNNLTSKASIIRRYCFEFMNQILHTWPMYILEKHIAVLQDSIKKGISDADSEARVFARKSFWGFSDHFKEQADALLLQLNASKQKALEGELSNSSSNNSLISGEKSEVKLRSRSASHDRSYESSTLGRVIKKGHQRFRSTHSDTSDDLETFKDADPVQPSQNGMLCSSSAVDIAQVATSKLPGRCSSGQSAMLAPARMSGSTTHSLYLETFKDADPVQPSQNGMLCSSSAVDIAQVATSKLPGRCSSGQSAMLAPARMSGSMTHSLYLETFKDANPVQPSQNGMLCSSSAVDIAQVATSKLPGRCSSGQSAMLAPARMSGSMTHSLYLETFKDANPVQPSQNGMLCSSSAVDIAQVATSKLPGRRSSGQSAMLAPARMSGSMTHSLSQQKSHAVGSSYSSSCISPKDPPGRNPRQSGMLQSQPNSRSISPNPRDSYITHRSSHVPLTPSQPRNSSTVTNPTSHGTCRETSPARSSARSSGYGLPGREKRLSVSKTSTKVTIATVETLKPSEDGEEFLADALLQPSRKHESYDSDDASELSSVCSEKSLNSNGKTSEDLGEIFTLLQSSTSQERKEGLISIQKLLRQNQCLTKLEIRKALEIFTRMFHDTHSKVFVMFLEVLIDLIQTNHHHMLDWLYVLMSRLLNKMGADILGSLQAKVHCTLDTVGETFPIDLQFNVLIKLMVDQTQILTMKVKLAMLSYLNALIPYMDPSDFMNSSDTRLVLSRIIAWTNEPKNTDVRKASQLVLFALFNLNPPEFSMMLSGIQKTFQLWATEILQNDLKGTSNEHELLTPRSMTSKQILQIHNRPSSRGAFERDEADTENVNPEDIYKSIKKTSSDLQSLSFNSKLDSFDEVKNHKDFTSQDSDRHDVRNISPDAGEIRKFQYELLHYQDESTLNNYSRINRAQATFDTDNDISYNLGSLDQEEQIIEILRELSSHNVRHKEHKNSMLTLIQLARGGMFDLLDDHFKSMLLILLETLGDDDLRVRALALRVLREILRNHYKQFEDYAELAILRILEAHKDPAREVVIAAKACAATLASSIQPTQTIRILIPVITNAQMPINLAAIKMQTEVVEQLTKEELLHVLPEAMPSLLKGYDDRECSVRKASVFCLVAIYTLVGESLRPYLSTLNRSQIKLLNLYIKRAQAQMDNRKVLLSPHNSDN